jgi:REP element-mobilizing transposase RayT
MKKRKVVRGVVNHCYQRTEDRGLIFYTLNSHLLYFTIYCVTAVKYNVRVLKLVLMPDHLHQAVIEDRRGDLSRFQKECQSRFARELNELFGRKGQFFEHPFGSAPKYDDKKIRTTLIYLDNNPVERKLVEQAEDYRWNFLAYGNSDHPFSDKIVLSQASMPLRRALQQVKTLHAAGRFLPYALLQKLFRSLPDDREREQLTDFIIVTYSVIDHAGAIRYFGSYQAELTAAHATSGSEYDLKEQFIGRSDDCYASMSSILQQTGCYKGDIHEIFRLSEAERYDLLTLLRRETFAPTRQIAAFLHLPVVFVNSSLSAVEVTS